MAVGEILVLHGTFQEGWYLGLRSLSPRENAIDASGSQNKKTTTI